MIDIQDQLEELDWSDARAVKGPRGVLQVQTLNDIDQDFWRLWRSRKAEMQALGVSISKDDETGDYEASWWHRPGGPSVPMLRAPLVRIEKVQNVLELDGADTLDPRIYNILTPRQRKAVMTLYSAYVAGMPSALDASQMGQGKTYIALALAHLLGLNYGVVCPANVVTKWIDTSIAPFDLLPEFVLSYDKARGGKRGEPFISRIPLAKGETMFRWNALEPVLLIFDEVQSCAAPDSLNAAVLKAAVSNANVFALGLSGTAANDPTEMRVIGEMLGLHRGHDWWSWCMANGCHKGLFGGLEFTKNRQKAIVHLSKIHAHIFPNHGCRLLKVDSKGEGTPPHDVGVTPVDSESRPKILEPYYQAVADAVEDDGDDALPITESLRQAQYDELELVPYVVSQATEALKEGQSVALFANFHGTVKAIGEMLKRFEPLFFTGKTSKDTKQENLRKFQTNSHALIILNLGAGSAGIDLHDTSGIHPRYSIILPTYKARTLLQAIDRTDRLGKLSASTVELPFLTTGIHSRMMKAVQRKLDNLSLLHDGELSELQLIQ